MQALCTSSTTITWGWRNSVGLLLKTTSSKSQIFPPLELAEPPVSEGSEFWGSICRTKSRKSSDMPGRMYKVIRKVVPESETVRSDASLLPELGKVMKKVMMSRNRIKSFFRVYSCRMDVRVK